MASRHLPSPPLRRVPSLPLASSCSQNHPPSPTPRSSSPNPPSPLPSPPSSPQAAASPPLHRPDASPLSSPRLPPSPPPSPPSDPHASTPPPAELHADDLRLVQQLVELGQAHLFAAWPPEGECDEEKAAMLAQLRTLDANYPGGLAAYVSSARRLLGLSQRGENPMEGWQPSVPEEGVDLQPGTPAYEQAERRGLEEAAAIGFVVPAGGLGERLGFSGVKFALPADTCSGCTVLEVYIGYILAIQREAHRRTGTPAELPLAIMVSADTEAGILALLQQNNFYGMKESQVTFLKQEKVAALSDTDARIALAAPFKVATKPHGHGDVHFLMHSSGTASRWAANGIRWIMFFQDTNTLYFSTFLASVGVSAAQQLAVNIIACPRKAKEAIGCVAQLDHEDGRRMVASVEYNQIEPLLVASGFADGDVNEPEGSAYPAGFSRFPGNINELLFHVPSYLEVLAATGGKIDEFINPKYADASRSTFKSPTRLECMMQDYVKTVPHGQKVGWTRYPQEFGYFPCKNDIVTGASLSAKDVPPQTASTAEMAVYNMHCTCLRKLGADVAPPLPRSFRGVGVSVGPMVSLLPDFAPCLTLLSAKLPSPSKIAISQRSSLVVRGENIEILSLKLDGALEIFVAPGASLRIESMEVVNKGWELVELSDSEQAVADEESAIRGFRTIKHETRTILVSEGQSITINGTHGKKASMTDLTVRSPRHMDVTDANHLLAKQTPRRKGCSCTVS
ncbi:hypothetical protein AB1Y20_020932 [Prymnesium parvum]|uniref:UTP-monosaccharide-1-phosphate uridylyltransferase n=1 Tax=Prymnesium parvum TaxID=97485 RepID=A0AB34JJW3_PRYPA